MPFHMKRRPRAGVVIAAVSMIAAALFTTPVLAQSGTERDPSGSTIGISATASPNPIEGQTVQLPPPEDAAGSLEPISPPPPTAPPAGGGTGAKVGINLSHVEYASVEWVFVDAMKQASSWYPQLVSGGPWDTGAYLALTADGYPLLAPGQAAATIMFVDLQGNYPGGQYVCLYQGAGTLEFGNDASIVSQTPGRVVLNVNPTNSGILMRITSTPDQNNPIRNVRIIPAAHESNYQTQVFHPTFLNKNSQFGVIRFMDWQRTNNSGQEHWANRPKPTYRTQGTGSGVAVEYMVQLCNKLGADAWFCMPHMATNDYVQQFATLVKSQLSPGLKVYIEHSNEVWNYGFQQATYAQNQGLASGLSGDPYLALVRWHSKRSVEMFDIWKSVFGTQADARLVRVLAAQHDNPWIGRQIMDYNNAYLKADALAVAPYFGSNLGWPEAASSTAAMSIDQILNAAQQNMYVRRGMTIEAYNDATSRGLTLVAYEGGQHLCAVGSAQSNQTLTDKFIQANRHWRMKDLYIEDLTGWFNTGAGVFVAYSSAGRYGNWGSWGVMEHQNQPRPDAPKYDGLLTFIENNVDSNPPPVTVGDFVSAVNFAPPGDGLVNAADLSFLLGEWGANPGSPADMVSSATFQPPPDGKVDSADLSVLLGNWTE